jgi:glutamyl-tRNA synthetase
MNEKGDVMNKKNVVVRFAPSPTGYLHIGGARTAIFNWLYARKHGGKFILRIEDTDAQRSTADSIEGIVEGLKWLGLDWDIGPYFQSAYIAQHKTAAHKLLDSGHAYKCFCTKEILDQKREKARAQKAAWQYDGTCRNLDADQIKAYGKEGTPYTIRLKVPRNGAVRFDDAVCGRITKNHDDIEDFVIVRSNGQPLYILSNAVDDIRDKVSHVIRGQDGLANTPKQILIYEALGASLPVFAHMSLALDPKKAKISKRRHGELVAVHYYRQNGFLPWALVNFMSLLGWSTHDAKQFFTPSELIEAFNLKGLSKTNCVFNVRKDDPKFISDPKAISMNAHYLRTMAIDELIQYVKAELAKAEIWDSAYEKEKSSWFVCTVDLIRGRFSLLTDFITSGRAYFSDDYPIDNSALEKNINAYPDFKNWFIWIASRFEALDEFNLKSVEAVLREAMTEFDIKPKILVNAVRTATTGQAVGPDFMGVLMVLGQQRIIARLLKAAK